MTEKRTQKTTTPTGNENDDTPSISGMERFVFCHPCAHQMSLSSLKHVRYLSIGRSGLRNRSRTNKMKFVKSSCVLGILCSIHKHPNELNDWLWHGHHSTIFLLLLNWTQINYPRNIVKHRKHNNFARVDVFWIANLKRLQCQKKGNKTGTFVKWNTANRFVVSHCSFLFFVFFLFGVFALLHLRKKNSICEWYKCHSGTHTCGCGLQRCVFDWFVPIRLQEIPQHNSNAEKVSHPIKHLRCEQTKRHIELDLCDIKYETHWCVWVLFWQTRK